MTVAFSSRNTDENERMREKENDIIGGRSAMYEKLKRPKRFKYNPRNRYSNNILCFLTKYMIGTCYIYIYYVYIKYYIFNTSVYIYIICNG